MKLTQSICDKLVKEAGATLTLPNGKSDYVAADDELPRFGLRLRRSPSGKILASWTCQYRTKQRGGGKPRIKISDFAALSLKDAREQARDLLAKAKLSQDAGKRRTRDTLQVVAAAYLDAKADEWAERSAAESRRYLCRREYWGELLSLRVDDITLREVADRITVIRRECGAATAGRARSSLSSCFTWAMKNGRADANPVAYSDKPKTSPRERVLTADELAAIWKACGDGSHYSAIIRLLVLFGARRSEVGSMAWSEFSDLDGSAPTWTLPKSRSKNKRPLTLPLTPLALSIVRSVPRMASRDFLFGSRGHGFKDWSRCKLALDERCGFAVADWTVHDLRRSFSTAWSEFDIAPPHIREAALNHVEGGIANVYNKAKYQAQLRQALLRWEDYIRRLVDGAEVIAFPQTQSA
jgi:integrase